jgi:hypothetical protein
MTVGTVPVIQLRKPLVAPISRTVREISCPISEGSVFVRLFPPNASLVIKLRVDISVGKLPTYLRERA